MDIFSLLLPISSHPLFKDEKYKLAFISLPFTHYMKIKRDGNCLYYCIGICFYNYLLNSENYQNILESFVPYFIKADVSDIVYENYIETIADMINAKRTVTSLNNSDLFFIVGYLRTIVASHLKIYKHKYSDFITNMSIDDYIKFAIEPMHTRAGNIEIQILAENLNFQINIFYFNNNCFKSHTIGSGYQVNLLFTPDHYELLFNKLS